MRSSSVLVVLVFIMCLVTEAHCQFVDTGYSHDRVSFSGLKKTKEVYLRNIMAEQTLSSGVASLDADIQALKNLSGIADVTYSIDSTQSHNPITLNVVERATALPIVNFGGISGNIWFQLGVTENNFRGMGDTALAFYQNNNGRHAGQIFFQKPRILSSNWGYSLNLCLLYTSPSPRDRTRSRMPSSA